MSDQGQHIEQENDHKWFTQIPNIYDDSDLDPYDFRLLIHYCRVGNCYQSVRTTAEICHISVGQVVASRTSLEKKGYIRTTTNEKGTISIIVVDKWPENFAKYSTMRDARQDGEQRSQDEQGVHRVNTTRSQDEPGCSCGEPKNNPPKNNPLEEQPTEEPPAKNPASRPSKAPNGAARTTRRRVAKPTKEKLSPEQEQVRNRLMHVFLEYSEAPPPTSYAQRNKLWHPPLEEIARRCDWDGDAAAELVKDAIAHMNKKGLEMKCPASILTAALGIKRRRANDFDDAWRGF